MFLNICQKYLVLLVSRLPKKDPPPKKKKKKKTRKKLILNKTS